MQKKAITYINERTTQWLMADKSKKGYICPICNSGSGPNGTGITENPNNRFHYTCWAGCFSNKTYVDILAIKNHIDESDTGAVVENACRELNLELDLNFKSVTKSEKQITLQGNNFKTVTNDPNTNATTATKKKDVLIGIHVTKEEQNENSIIMKIITSRFISEPKMHVRLQC